MQTQFTERELGDCLELVIDHRGKTPKKLGADWVDSGVPTISAKNVNGGRLVSRDSIRHVSLDVYKRWMKEDVKRGDCFLVSEGATLGECMLWDYDYPIVLGQRIFCLRANPEILYPRFLYAYMTSRSFQDEVSGRATGTSVDGLRQTEVLKLKLRLPPIKQQEQIGDVLYNLNKKIELNRQMNETLEAMARALFQSWFVDFDPVRAKLDGSQPSGLDATTAALFPDEFEDSELGPIPKGWSVGTIGGIAEVIDCLHSKKPIRAQTGQLFLQLNNIRDDGLLDLADAFLISDEDYANWISRMEARCGDCVITNVGRVGAVSQIPEGIRAALGRNMTGIRCKSDFAFPTFLLQCLLSDAMKEEIGLKTDSGTILDALNVKGIPFLRFVQPPTDLAMSFERATRPMRQAMEKNVHQSRTLALIRDALLPKLLSGKLKIPT